MLNLSDKIQVVTHPVALPGTCVVCGKSSNGVTKFIDFNFNIDYFGAVIFCEECIKQALIAVEGAVPKNVSDLALTRLTRSENVVKVLELKNRDLQEEVERLNNVLTALRHVFPALSDSDFVHNLVESSSESDYTGLKKSESGT